MIMLPSVRAAKVASSMNSFFAPTANCGMDSPWQKRVQIDRTADQGGGWDEKSLSDLTA